MFDAIQNELQYRFGTQGANEGTTTKGADGQYDIGLLGRALGVTPEMMTTAGNSYDRRAFNSKPLGQKAASYGLAPTSGAVNEFEIGKAVRKAENVESLQQLAQGLGVNNAMEMTDSGVLTSAIRSQKKLMQSIHIKMIHVRKKNKTDIMIFSKISAMIAQIQMHVFNLHTKLMQLDAHTKQVKLD